MSVSTDPRYRSLAATALAAMGVPSSGPIIAAIVSQWQCEQPPSAWPPVHNNPGYVTVGALSSVGVNAAYATTSPGVHFLAQFGSPGAGATAYGQLIGRGKRYQPVVAAARARDGAAYLKAVTDAGYGTRYSCAIATYKALGGSVPVVAPGAPGGSTVDYESRTLPFRDVFVVNFGSNGGTFTPSTVLTDPWIRQYVLFEVETFGAGVPGAADQWEKALTAAATKYRGTIGSQLPATITVSLAAVPKGQLDNPLSAAGAIVGGIGDVLRNAVFLLAILGTVVLGLYLVATSGEAAAA